MSLISVLFPLPLTPVTTVMTPSGMRMVRSCRLCSRAPCDGEPFAGERARFGAMQDAGRSGEIAAGERFGAGHDVCGRALGDDIAAETAGAGAEIEDIVGVADGFFIVLDDEDRVAQIAQLFERFDEAGVVALVQADGGLVEDVEDTAQA